MKLDVRKLVSPGSTIAIIRVSLAKLGRDNTGFPTLCLPPASASPETPVASRGQSAFYGE
ncbi:MAG: hypothetical protein ACREFG_12175 [Chthoniobacterales bacterium]